VKALLQQLQRLVFIVALCIQQQTKETSSSSNSFCLCTVLPLLLLLLLLLLLDVGNVALFVTDSALDLCDGLVDCLLQPRLDGVSLFFTARRRCSLEAG